MAKNEFDTFIEQDEPKQAKNEFDAFLEADATPEDTPADTPRNLKNPDVPNKVGIGEALTRSAARGATLGAADEITAGVGAGADVLMRDDLDLSQLPEVYSIWRDVIRKRDKQAAKDQPTADTVGEVIGGGMLGGGLGALGRVSETANAVNSVINPLAKSGQGIKEGLKQFAKAGTATGALYGFNTSDKDTIGQTLLDTGVGAAGGLVTSPLAFGLAGGFKAGAEGTAKAGSHILGKKRDVTEPYLNNPEKYNDPDITFENIQDPLNRHIKSAAEAEAELGNIAADAKGAAQTAASDLKFGRRDDVTAARKNLDVAEEVLRQEQLAYRQGLDDTKIDPATADVVRDTLRAQGKKTGDLAQRQMTELEPLTSVHSLSPLDSIIEQGLEREKIQNILPDNENTRALKDFQTLLNQFRPPNPNNAPGTIPIEMRPHDMVKLRQNIDSLIEGTFNRDTGGYSQRHERIGRDMRNEINNILDSQLPGNSGYTTLRSDLARESTLRSKASSEFGGDNLMSKLSGLSNPNNAERKQLLEDLGTSNNTDLISLIKPYLDAKAAKADRVGMDAALRNLPASQTVNTARKGLSDAQDLLDPRALSRDIAALPESQQSLDAAQFLDAAKDGSANYKTLGDTQSAIRRILNASPKKPETATKDAFKAVGNEMGTDLLDQIETFRVKDALSAGGSPNGSRLVNIAGAGGSAVAGAPGRFVADLIAGGMDYSKGRTAKFFLDQAIGLRNPIDQAALSAVRVAVDKLSASQDPKAKKYLQALDSAAQRGPEAIAVTHAMLERDPEFSTLVAGVE